VILNELTKEKWEVRQHQRRRKERALGCKAWRDGDVLHGDNHDGDDGSTSTCLGNNWCSEGHNQERCFNCSEQGHIAKNCRKYRRERSLLIDADSKPIVGGEPKASGWQPKVASPARG
jgi:hypothetical protein